MPFPYRLIPLPSGDWDDPFDHQAIEMAVSHNMFIRALNAVHAQAKGIRQDQVKDFAFFCLCFCEMLHHHHEIEEALVFPFYEEKLGAHSMDANVEQHRAFEAGFASFQNYFKDVYAGNAVYQSTVVIEKLDAFGDVLISHLVAEIPTLDSNRLRAAGFTAQDFKDLEARLMNAILKQVSLFTSVPVGLLCHEKASLPQFPPMPKLILWAVRYVFSWRYSRSWTFAPCDYDGKLKPGLGNEAVPSS